MQFTITKLLLTMSKYALTGFIVQFLLFSLALAYEGNTQNKAHSVKEVELELEFNNASLQNIFSTIEEATEFDFIFYDKDIASRKSFSMEKQKIALSDLLLELSKTYDFAFRQLNRNITVKKLSKKGTDRLAVKLAVDVTISGKITDENGEGLPGASVVVKGSTQGTTTDMDGNFKLTVPDNATIVVSYVGYMNTEIAVDSRTVYDISMRPDAEQLEEIVVTALGVKREKKSLGYAVQEVKGQTILEAREPNMVNALAGKIAGVQIVKGSNGPAGSSKIILRGYSSLSGDNQPLIVVDGVPLNNFTGADNNDYWNPSPDFGNGLGDINADDIESMSVLKGASAAALYGSRAGNGVILITTKKGKAKEGLGISYSLTTGVQSIFMKPDLQTSFGQGDQGVYNALESSSWGPKIEGQTIQDYKGDDITMQAYDNIDNFYKDGFSQNHNLSFQQQLGEGSSLYTSASYFKDESNIPGAVLERLNLLARSVSTFGASKNWTVDTKVQYISSVADNRPQNGNNVFNSYGTLITVPVSLDVRAFEAGADQYGNQLWYDTNTTQVNPYWSYRNNKNQDARDRFLLNGSLKNEITDWLTAELKFGADLYTTNTESKLHAGSPASQTGRFGLGKSTFSEKNFSGLLKASKDNVFGKFGGTFTLGGNLMSQRSSSISGNSGELVVPNLFSLNNGVNPASVSQGFSQKKINSVYGLFQLNYDGYLFIDVTGRNDWSSSLSKENRSFFYPSVSTSFVFSDLMEIAMGDLPSWFNFGKFRASYAEVGNDLAPYRLVNAYSIGNDAMGNTTATTGKTLFNPNVRNELIKSIEFGLEGRFFNNRLHVDATWYKSNSTNQLISIPLDPLSGFNNKIVNAGDIQNTGVEIGVNAVVIENSDNGFSWEVNLNYTKNRNTIEELSDDVTQYTLGGFDNLAVMAEVGGNYGVIWGTKYQRVEDESSEHFGKIIVDGDGLPLGTSDKYILGSQVPDALIGVTNKFAYKNWSLNFLISGNMGGEIFSGTNHALQAAGLAAATVVDGQREDIVFDGVVADGSDNYVANTAAVSPQNLWTAITTRTGNLGITEANVYDATNIRLRNVGVNYNLPNRWFSNSPIQSLKVGMSMNNVWMLKSHLNGVDPESVFATGTNAVGFENLSSPTSRTVFFNVAVKF